MTLIETSKCKLKFLNYKGLGVGQTDKGLVELPYTLENEIVEFERHKYRGHLEFVLKNVIEESPNRVKPQCTYFGACGGCLLQHLNPNIYNNFKLGLLKDSLIEKDIRNNIAPLISIPFGQRRRANMEILKKNDRIFLGFYRFHSHQIINIDQCPAILDSLSNLIEPLKLIFRKILTDRQKAQIFLNQASNGIHLIFDVRDQYFLSEENRQEMVRFCHKYNIIQLILSAINSKEIVIYETARPYIEIDGVRVGIEANSFSQATYLSDHILKKLVLDFFLSDIISPSKNMRVADLFCGRGTFTIPLSRHFSTTGFELDHKSLQAIRKAAVDSNLLIELEERNLFDFPLINTLLNHYKFIVINPPRAGALAQSQNLAVSIVEKIVYISCNPRSFARDAKVLIEGGYKLNNIIPLDQFPFTTHLEVVGLFQRL
ncbi:MAG: class I SAM-dependent RNA methyltransferase [Janthinobacterium lividum]